MGDLQHLCGALAYNNAGRHGVACCDAGHNGTVSDTQVLDPIDLKFAVYNRHGIASHLGTAGLVPADQWSVKMSGHSEIVEELYCLVVIGDTLAIERRGGRLPARGSLLESDCTTV